MLSRSMGVVRHCARVLRRHSDGCERCAAWRRFRESSGASVGFAFIFSIHSAIQTPATFDRRGRTAHTLSQCIEQRILCAFCSLPLDLDGVPRLPSNLQRVLDNSTSGGRTDQSMTSMSRIPYTLLA